MNEPVEERDSKIDSPGRRAWRRFKHNRAAVLSALFLALLLLAVMAWPVMLSIAGTSGTNGAGFASAHDPERVSEEQFVSPGVRHWFGTDVHGRDVFSRVLYGA